jgi:hypothetical protein
MARSVGQIKTARFTLADLRGDGVVNGEGLSYVMQLPMPPGLYWPESALKMAQFVI